MTEHDHEQPKAATTAPPPTVPDFFVTASRWRDTKSIPRVAGDSDVQCDVSGDDDGARDAERVHFVKLRCRLFLQFRFRFESESRSEIFFATEL